MKDSMFLSGNKLPGTNLQVCWTFSGVSSQNLFSGKVADPLNTPLLLKATLGVRS